MSAHSVPASVATFIPVAVIALILWAVARWGHAPVWALLVAVLLGVILSGTVLGPDIANLLSQLSGGRLH